MLACPYCEAPEPYKKHDYGIPPDMGGRPSHNPYEYIYEYDENGQIVLMAPYLWQPSGPFEWHYENGQLKQKGTYKDGGTAWSL